MARYEYRCPSCGAFESTHRIGAAPADAPCPGCGETSPRRFSPPMLAETAPQVGRLLSKEEKSREAPEVVRSVPPAARRSPPGPQNPRHATLPRP